MRELAVIGKDHNTRHQVKPEIKLQKPATSETNPHHRTYENSTETRTFSASVGRLNKKNTQ